MLAPDSRSVAFDLIRPPGGYRLGFAALTTYTLNLEALLILPLSVLAQADGGLEELLADPMQLLHALREAGDRIHVFVDETGIAIPSSARPLYSMLEASVHPVRAPNGGAFHAKTWVARFVPVNDESGDRPPLLRVAVLSRNLTFDRSWDVALASEAPVQGGKPLDASRPVGDLLSALPQLATQPLGRHLTERLQTLSEETARTPFPSPKGFTDPIEFHAIGLPGRGSWRPPTTGDRTLAIAPFVNRTGLAAVRGAGGANRTLVSRQEELDALREGALEEWKEVLVLSDSANGEPEDAFEGDVGSDCAPLDRREQRETATTRLSGLHAKMIAVEHRSDVTWYVGSANLTAAAFGGGNVETMAAITGRKGYKGGKSGYGIDRFFEAGFQSLCRRYQRALPPHPEPEAVTRARRLIEETRETLVKSGLRATCSQHREIWTLKLTHGEGCLEFPETVEAAAWPISVRESEAQRLDLPLTWSLPAARLTAFMAFRLSVPLRSVDDIRMVLRLPTEGLPGDRMHEVLRTLLDSREKFLRFLRALLGGLDGMVGWARDAAKDDQPSTWILGQRGETLLDDLVRTASRDPGRLRPVRRLIADLRKTEEGRRIVPDDLFEIWTAVEEALGPEPSA